LLSDPLHRQGVLFALFGLIATAIHAGTALLLHQKLGLGPLASNLCGYMAAVCVSYFGNARITFKKDVTIRSFLRFAVVSLAGLAMSQSITWVFTQALGQPFWLALAVAIGVVPVFTFIMSRAWTFRS
jgi:putative flippase GtrA